jgi:pimeloyl-ACP methyl ester carboxylesterase
VANSFSDKPKQNGWSVEKIARAWSELMLRLGYQRYYAQGGDWGAVVTTAIALQDTEHCHGVHLNALILQPDPATMNSLTNEEKDDLAAMQHYQGWDSGYWKQQSTRPQTLGYGLADSPAGQAAWILEKFWPWITRDEMLDDIMLQPTGRWSQSDSEMETARPRALLRSPAEARPHARKSSARA